MKRLSILALILLLAVFTAACGNASGGNDPTNNGNQNSGETNTGSTNNDNTGSNNDNGDSNNDNTGSNDQDYMKSKMAQINFSEIEVEVSYGKDQEYEAEIEQDKNRPIEAEIEDELNNVYKKGKAAFDEIYPKASQLNLSSNSSDQEVIDQVLKAFDLKPDYEKFEVEITFNDGTKLEVEDKKK